MSVFSTKAEAQPHDIQARNAFLRMNRRAIAMMFVRLSVCLSVWYERAL